MSDRDLYYYQFPTKWGVISIIPETLKSYKVMFDSDHFGSYSTPQQAADDVSGGHTHTPSIGVDFDEMNVPEDIEDWQKKLFAHFKKMRPA